jgi:hypothetical protein
MPPIRLVLLCATLPFALCACAGPRVAVPQAVALAPGQHADIGNGATLSYDSYSDSRCPKGVWCVWSGELVYHFTLVTPKDTEAFTVTLPGTTHISPALGGARITLDPSHVPPPPHDGSGPAQYAVTLTVSRP